MTIVHAATAADLRIVFGSVPTLCGVFVDRDALATVTSRLRDVTCPDCLAVVS